jgi:hypothetical protein
MAGKSPPNNPATDPQNSPKASVEPNPIVGPTTRAFRADFRITSFGSVLGVTSLKVSPRKIPAIGKAITEMSTTVSNDRNTCVTVRPTSRSSNSNHPMTKERSNMVAKSLNFGSLKSMRGESKDLGRDHTNVSTGIMSSSILLRPNSRMSSPSEYTNGRPTMTAAIGAENSAKITPNISPDFSPYIRPDTGSSTKGMTTPTPNRRDRPTRSRWTSRRSTD